MAAEQNDDPFSHEEFNAECARLQINKTFAVAVSGGRDSMALAVLAAYYAKHRSITAFAYTVDHGLRAGSAAEAQQVSAWCRDLGFAHRTLKWTGDKPSTGVQDAARQARYFLLSGAAAHDGVDAVLTGHSKNDVAETYVMRRSRDEAPTSLAAMRAEIKIAAGAGAPVRLLRPFLDVSRNRLTATVKAHGQDFIDDPSNDDPAFERVRVRSLINKSDGDVDRDSLAAAAFEMRDAAGRLRDRELEFFKRAGGCFYRWGGASLDADYFFAKDAELTRGILRRLVRAVSGIPYAPAVDVAARALGDLEYGKMASFSGALIQPSGAHIWVYREPAALLGRSGVPPKLAENLPTETPLLWDRRFAIENPAHEGSLHVAPLGASKRAIDQMNGCFYGPREALLSAPGVFSGPTLIAAPGRLFETGRGVNLRPLAEERFFEEIIRFSEV